MGAELQQQTGPTPAPAATPTALTLGDPELQTAMATVNKIRTGEQLVRVGEGSPAYGRNAEEQAVAKVLQRAINEGLENLGSTTRVAVDGSITRNGATANAYQEFQYKINASRTHGNHIPLQPDGDVNIGPQTLAALSLHAPNTLLNPQFPIAPDLSQQDMRALAPVLSGEKTLSFNDPWPLNKRGEDSPDSQTVAAVNRVLAAALRGNPDAAGLDLSGSVVTKDTLEAASLVSSSAVMHLGKHTLAKIVQAAAKAPDPK